MHELLSDLVGKQISVNLKSGSYFQGVVSEVVDTGDGFIWIHIIDKFGKIVVFLSSEIKELKEK